MSTEEENKNQDEKNSKLEKENKLLRERLGLQSDSLDLSSSLVDSLKEAMGIQSKRTTFDSKLLGINKQINSEVLNQKTDLSKIDDISKQIKKNADLLNKAKVIESSLAKGISKEGKIRINQVASEFGQIKSKQKLIDQELAKTEEQGGINATIVENLQSQIASHEATAGIINKSLSPMERQLLYTREQRKALEEQNKERKKQSGYIDEFNKKIGFGGQLAAGLDKTLQKAGVPSLGIASAIDKTRKNFLEAKEQGEEFNVVASITENIGENIKEAFSVENITQSVFVATLDALISSDKAAGELAKNLGISYKEALNLEEEASNAALAMNDLLVDSGGIIEAQQKLNAYFHTGAKFSMEMAANFSSIQKRTGLSDEAMGFFAKTSMKAGGSIKDTLKDVHTTVLEQNKQLGVSLSVKEVQEKISKTANTLQLTYKGSVEELTKAVFAAHKLGAEMSTIEGIANSLLDFEGSIEAELQAELLLGKQINLEKARQFALEGDMGKVAEEVLKNKAIMNAFDTKNVVAQQAAAKALGLSRNELADMVMNQQKLEIIKKKGFESINDAQNQYNILRSEGLSAEEAANKVGDKSLANQLETTSQAEKFEAIISRVQEIFTSMATPLLGIFETMTAIVGGADNLAGILSTIAIAYGAIQAYAAATAAFEAVITAKKMIQGSLDARAVFLGYTKVGQMVAQAAAWAIINPFTALAGLAVAAGVGTLIYSQMKDGVIGKDGGMVVSGPKGSIQLDKDDSIVAGTNLGGGGGGNGQSMAMLKKELNAQNQLLKKLLDKDTNVYMDGNKVGTQLALSNPRMQ